MGRKQDIEARMRALEAERALLDRYGDDIYDDGDVIKFTKTFRPNEYTAHGDMNRRFTFAALKIGDMWYLTGRTARGKTWDELVEFMFKDNPATNFMVAMESDFLSPELYRDRLAELARLAENLKIELPVVQVRRGGVGFPSRGGWSESAAQYIEDEVAEDPDPQADDDAVIKDTGGWCAPSPESQR